MKVAIPIDSSPYAAWPLPFANETEVQKFVEKYAEKILGLKVIASTTPGKRALLKIDVLAVDGANTPFIIECKWNHVGPSAIRQLVRYRNELEAKRFLFEERLKEGRSVAGKGRKPVLVAIGYQYEDSVLREAKAQSVVCLTYTYHHLTDYTCQHVSAPFDMVEPRSRGKVSIQRVHQLAMPMPLHRRVCKRRITIKRFKNLPNALQTVFWTMDERLRELDTVSAIYGKDPEAYYRIPRGRFAEAKICPKSIQWRYGPAGGWKDGPAGSVEMFGTRDAHKIFDLLRHAHGEIASS